MVNDSLEMPYDVRVETFLPGKDCIKKEAIAIYFS